MRRESADTIEAGSDSGCKKAGGKVAVVPIMSTITRKSMQTGSVYIMIMTDQEKPKTSFVTRILQALAIFFLIVGVYYFAKAYFS